MVDVSQAFLDAVYQTSRYVQLRGTLSKYGVDTPLTDDDFVVGTISRNSKAVSGSNFQIGDVYIDYMSFSLGIRDNQFNDIVGSTVTFDYGVELADGTYEWCKLGTFYINTDGVTRKNKTLAVTADSMLCKTDKNVTDITSGLPYDIALWACERCGVELGTTQEEFEAFVNGAINLVMPSHDDYNGIKTYRDLLMWLASWCCTFVTCDVDGKIVFKPYSGLPKWALNPDTVISKQFNDYPLDIQNVTMEIGGTQYSIVEDIPQDNTLVLEENPFYITYVADELRRVALENTLNELKKVQFTPYKIEFNGNPALEVGDWFTYKGSNYLVTSSTFNYRGKCTIQGVGLKTGNTKKQSSSSRGGSTGGGGGKSAEYRTIRYTNAKRVLLRGMRSVLFEFQFSLVANATPIVNVLATCNIKKAGTLQIVLRYNGVDLKPVFHKYMPVGEESISFNFALASRDVQMTHVLYGYISSDDGAEGEITIQDVLASVSASGVVSDIIDWDGIITITEYVNVMKSNFNGFNMLGVSEQSTIGEGLPVDKTTETIDVPLMAVGMVGVNMLGIYEKLDIVDGGASVLLPLFMHYHLTATQFELSGSAVASTNSSAEDGYNIDYIGTYASGNHAIINFEMPADGNATLYVSGATQGVRYLGAYVDDVLITGSIDFDSRNWNVPAKYCMFIDYPLKAGSHKITLVKASGSYAPLVHSADVYIKYNEEGFTNVVTDYILTATQAKLSGNAKLRTNGSARSGYDIDYLGLYSSGNLATFEFEAELDGTVNIDIEAATNENRYLAVYLDDVVIASSVTYHSGSYSTGKLINIVTGHAITAGTHTITLAKASGNNAPLVDYVQIHLDYNEEV